MEPGGVETLGGGGTVSCSLLVFLYSSEKRRRRRKGVGEDGLVKTESKGEETDEVCLSTRW